MPAFHRSLSELILFCLLVSGEDIAQSPQPGKELTADARSPGADTLDYTFTKRVDEVNVVFTVTDSKGRFISDLPASEFQVLDNHLPARKVNYFQQQSNLPLRVALLVDLSDSVRHRFKFEQRAATAFLKKILRPMSDSAFLVGFDAKVHLVQDVTSDPEELGRAINGLQPGGDTALYDAIVYTANKLSSETGARRAIILISDGLDTSSRSFFNDAAQALTRSEAAMYALSTNSPDSGRYPKGNAVMDLLTIPSGGHILPAHEESELKRAFAEVEKAIRSQYVVGYCPSDFKSNGSYRKIEILPSKAKLKAQSRRGYYAPRELIVPK